MLKRKKIGRKERIRIVIQTVLDLETKLVKHNLPTSFSMSDQFWEDV